MYKTSGLVAVDTDQMLHSAAFWFGSTLLVQACQSEFLSIAPDFVCLFVCVKVLRPSQPLNHVEHGQST